MSRSSARLASVEIEVPRTPLTFDLENFKLVSKKTNIKPKPISSNNLDVIEEMETQKNAPIPISSATQKTYHKSQDHITISSGTATQAKKRRTSTNNRGSQSSVSSEAPIRRPGHRSAIARKAQLEFSESDRTLSLPTNITSPKHSTQTSLFDVWPKKSRDRAVIPLQPRRPQSRSTSPITTRADLFDPTPPSDHVDWFDEPHEPSSAVTQTLLKLKMEDDKIDAETNPSTSLKSDRDNAEDVDDIVSDHSQEHEWHPVSILPPPILQPSQAEKIRVNIVKAMLEMSDKAPQVALEMFATHQLCYLNNWLHQFTIMWNPDFKPHVRPSLFDLMGVINSLFRLKASNEEEHRHLRQLTK
jgi:hypothetical protein